MPGQHVPLSRSFKLILVGGGGLVFIMVCLLLIRAYSG
jgi:hypothetical protein